MINNGVVRWSRRITAVGAGTMLLQAQGCGIDEALANELLSLVLQTLVNSLLGGLTF